VLEPVPINPVQEVPNPLAFPWKGSSGRGVQALGLGLGMLFIGFHLCGLDRDGAYVPGSQSVDPGDIRHKYSNYTEGLRKNSAMGTNKNSP
jgi:hypothetical protein